MKGDDLPADDHLVPYIKPSMISDNGTADTSDFRSRANGPYEG